MSLFKKNKKITDGVVDIDVNELVEKRRSPVGIPLLILNIIAFTMTLFQMYCAGFKTIDVMQFRALHMAFGMCILFLIYPMTKKSSRTKIPWYDWVFALWPRFPICTSPSASSNWLNVQVLSTR